MTTNRNIWRTKRKDNSKKRAKKLGEKKAEADDEGRGSLYLPVVEGFKEPHATLVDIVCIYKGVGTPYSS